MERMSIDVTFDVKASTLLIVVIGEAQPYDDIAFIDFVRRYEDRRATATKIPFVVSTKPGDFYRSAELRLDSSSNDMTVQFYTKNGTPVRVLHSQLRSYPSAEGGLCWVRLNMEPNSAPWPVRLIYGRPAVWECVINHEDGCNCWAPEAPAAPAAPEAPAESS